MRLAPELKIIGKQTEQGLNMEYIFILTEEKKSQHNIWCSMERAAEWSQALTLSYNLEQIIILLCILSFYDVIKQVQWMTVTM